MVRIGLGGLTVTVLGDLGTSSGTRGGGSSGISGTIGESPEDGLESVRNVEALFTDMKVCSRLEFVLILNCEEEDTSLDGNDLFLQLARPELIRSLLDSPGTDSDRDVSHNTVLVGVNCENLASPVLGGRELV